MFTYIDKITSFATIEKLDVVQKVLSEGENILSVEIAGREI